MQSIVDGRRGEKWPDRVQYGMSIAAALYSSRQSEEGYWPTGRAPRAFFDAPNLEPLTFIRSKSGGPQTVAPQTVAPQTVQTVAPQTVAPQNDKCLTRSKSGSPQTVAPQTGKCLTRSKSGSPQTVAPQAGVL